MIICSYEDRAGALAGLKLMAISLSRAMPDVAIDLTCPQIAAAVASWAEANGLGNVRARGSRGFPGEGWTVKPGKVMELLDEGHEEVVWIDTDIVATRDFRPLLEGVPPASLVLAQEFRAHRPGWTRACVEAWGLEFARELPFALNTGFMRLTPSHRALLGRWEQLQASPAYLEARTRPISARPFHLTSDQEALCALLGSAEFAGLPVHFLRCGGEIIQNSGANGYHVVERLRNLGRGLPPLIHMLGREKPWDFPTVPSPRDSPGDYLELVSMELSPYTSVARRFAAALGEPAPWLEVRTGLGRALHWGCLGHPSLQGLPLAVAAQCLSRARRPKI